MELSGVDSIFGKPSLPPQMALGDIVKLLAVHNVITNEHLDIVHRPSSSSGCQSCRCRTEKERRPALHAATGHLARDHVSGKRHEARMGEKDGRTSVS